MARINLLSSFRTNFWIASLGGGGSSVIRSRSSFRWSILQMIITIPNSIINEFKTNMHIAQAKRKKSETAVRKSDMEYYAACIKTERSRLDWEGAVKRGAKVVSWSSCHHHPQYQQQSDGRPSS